MIFLGVLILCVLLISFASLWAGWQLIKLLVSPQPLDSEARDELQLYGINLKPVVPEIVYVEDEESL